eukprot:73860_1
MASNKTWSFVCILLISRVARTDHITCGDVMQGQPCNISSTDITCIDDGDCLIDCIGDYICHNTHFNSINCANNGHCMVKCIGQGACEDMPINCPPSPYSCTIECEGDQACYRGTIGDGQQANIGGDLVARCIGDWFGVCMGFKFVCPSAPSTCNITCWMCAGIDVISTDSGGLFFNGLIGGTQEMAVINCPSGNYPCVTTSGGTINGGGSDLVVELRQITSGIFTEIHCPSDAACNFTCTVEGCLDDTLIYATSSSMLNLVIAISSQVYTSGTTGIWCPNSSVGATCNIFVSSSNGLVDLRDLHIHVEGDINDIALICDYSQYDRNCTYFDSMSAPIMHCLGDSSWLPRYECIPVPYGPPNSLQCCQCTNASSICNPNTYITTFPTTTEPTYYPTASTNYPTSSTNSTTTITNDPTSAVTRVTIETKMNVSTSSVTTPSIYPTAVPVVSSTTFTVSIVFNNCEHEDETNACELNKTVISSQIEDILVAYIDYDANILSTVIINNEVVIILSVAMDAHNVLIGETISDNIE